MTGPLEVERRHLSVSGKPGVTYTIRYKGGETLERNYKQLRIAKADIKEPIAKEGRPLAPAQRMPCFLPDSDNENPLLADTPVASRTRNCRHQAAQLASATPNPLLVGAAASAPTEAYAPLNPPPTSLPGVHFAPLIELVTKSDSRLGDPVTPWIASIASPVGLFAPDATLAWDAKPISGDLQPPTPPLPPPLQPLPSPTVVITAVRGSPPQNTAVLDALATPSLNSRPTGNTSAVRNLF